ncbi:MAG: DUF418 domain-containing protein [Pseudomonadota bacterium]
MALTAAAPPPAERIAALDLVRGVAVLGILLLNIVSFALPTAAYANPRAWGGWHGADLAVYLVNFVLFDGKMRGLFSFLFGASMLLVIERAEARDADPAQVHIARMMWLFAFGIAHLWLVWDGDILAHYALVGSVAFAARNMPVHRLLVLGTMLVALQTALFAWPTIHSWIALQLPPDSPDAAQAAAWIANMRDGYGVPPASTIAREIDQMRGGYAEIVATRFAAMRAQPLVQTLLYGAETLAYMLFGMAALRSGLLTGTWPVARYRRWAFWCFALSLPPFLALAAWMVVDRFSLISVMGATLAAATPIRPVMILGWACLILALARPGGALGLRLAAVGRMAFTNYLATSLICTTLFYGYGGDLFGRVSRWQLYGVVVLVWAALLLWSTPWLARFRYGPFEWLWRSLARGRPQPMRRAELANDTQ